MGGGTWSADTYTKSTGTRISSGTTFAWTDAIRRGTVAAGAHPDLDPLVKAGPTSPFAGKNVRESRDNPDHPNSTPLITVMDVTGSMGYVPAELQTDLSGLFALLLRKGYLEDPQVMTGGYGDANCDHVPLQISQFESDNRIDEALDKLYIEGGGGGNSGETAAAAWYFAAEHTATDAWDKRGKRGYLFTIGDEVTFGLTKMQIKKIMGDDVQGNLSATEIVTMAQERWNVFHIVIKNSTSDRQKSISHYTELLGDNCLILEKGGSVAALIAGVVGAMEGAIDDIDDFDADLVAVGASNGGNVGKEVSRFVKETGSVVTSAAPAGLNTTGGGTTIRL